MNGSLIKWWKRVICYGFAPLYTGGGSAPSSSSTSVTYSPAEQAARDKIMQEGMAAYDTSKGNPGQYPGARPTGFSNETQAAMQTAWNSAGNVQAGVDKAQSANDFGLKDVLYADSNPYLQSYMDAATKPMINQFTNAGGPMSTIRGDSVQTGGYGGSRQGIAEGLAMQGLEGKVGDMRTTMASAGYDAGLTQMNNSIKNEGMLTLMQQTPGQIMSGVGGAIDTKNQQEENYAAAQRDYQQNSQWQPLQNLANIVYGGSNGTTTSNGQVPQPDTTAQTVGTVGSMAMMAWLMY